MRATNTRQKSLIRKAIDRPKFSLKILFKETHIGCMPEFGPEFCISFLSVSKDFVKINTYRVHARIRAHILHFFSLCRHTNCHRKQTCQHRRTCRRLFPFFVRTIAASFLSLSDLLFALSAPSILFSLAALTSMASRGIASRLDSRVGAPSL